MATFDLGKLKNRWLLLDANFIISYYKYSNEPEFGSFIKSLKDSNVETVTSQHVVYEILSSSASLHEFNLQKVFIDSLVATVLKDDAEIIDIATNISCIYKNKQVKGCGAGMTDCMLSAQLKRFGNQIALLTKDLSDFPLLIHKRHGVHPIDVKNQVLTFAYIQFDNNAYETACNDFKKRT